MRKNEKAGEKSKAHCWRNAAGCKGGKKKGSLTNLREKDGQSSSEQTVERK